MPENFGPDFFNSDTKVNVYWGNRNYAIYIGEVSMKRAMALADKWFKENDHFFNTEYFSPHRRFLCGGGHIMVDYGSYSNFLYCIPV